MERTQAVELNRHLRRAAGAINRATEIISALDEADRELLAAPLVEIMVALRFKLLQEVYDRYPDLRPPGSGRSKIDTARQWKDIVLPESVSETDLDSAILSALKAQWRKTAVIISRALEQCKALGLAVDDEVLGVRIQALAKANRLASQGDLRKWGYSEVRLNAENGGDV
jgi:hypothetical protein